MTRIPVRARRRLAAAAATFALTLAGSTFPAIAGIDPGGLGRVPVDLPFTSSNVDVVGTIPMPGAIGATFRDDVMYVTGQGGVQTFDISNPAIPVPMGDLALPHFENEDVTIGGNTLLVAADHAFGFLNTIYLIDISDPRVLTLRGRIVVPYKAHTVTCLDDCEYAYVAGQSGLGLIKTTGAGEWLGVVGPTETVMINGQPTTRHILRGTHDVWVDSSGIAWVAAGNGTFGVNISDLHHPQLVARTDARGDQSPYNDFILHNSWRPNLPGTNTPGNILLITEEDYASPQCIGAGSFQAWEITGPLDATNPAVLVPIDTWTTAEGTLPTGEDRTRENLECSAHWFEERNGYVSIAWYGNGTRFLDVRNPADIRQVGYYVPTTTSVWGGAVYWAPGVDNDIVYSVDASRGIDVLRVDVTQPDTSAVPASAGSASLTRTAAKPHPQFGWSCRIPLDATA